MNWIAEASPRLKARMAGVLYFFSLLTAAFAETFVRGRLNYAGGYVAIAGMGATTLIVYSILKPVNRGIASLAASFAFVGLAFEALRWQPQGLNVALVFMDSIASSSATSSSDRLFCPEFLVRLWH